MKQCELSECENFINETSPKKILITDFGDWQWLADVCDTHYEEAHPSRKEKTK